jgi:hypothetical protein
MSRSQPVTGDQLKGLSKLFWQLLVGEWNDDYSRKIECAVGAELYRVYDHDEVICQTRTADKAALRYNEIKPRQASQR